MGFVEPRPDIITPQPGFPWDELGESILDNNQPAQRIFPVTHTCVVIGRGQDPAKELHLDAILQDNIPIYRRLTGGGAVVLTKGVVVIGLRLPGDERDPQRHFARVNAAVIPALADHGLTARCQGHGDLTIPGPDNSWRKILGASLRQDQAGAYYLASLLCADLAPLMSRYLATPSRMPTYRDHRPHGDFCTFIPYTPAILASIITHTAHHASLGWPTPTICPT